MKVAGIDQPRFDGTARVFDGEALAMEAILAGQINAGDIAKEDAGAGKTEKIRQYDIYRKMLAERKARAAGEGSA